MSKTIKFKILGTEIDVYTDDNGRARVQSKLKQTCGCCGKYVCDKRIDPQRMRYNEMVDGLEKLIATHFEVGGKASKTYIGALEDAITSCAKVAYK